LVTTYSAYEPPFENLPPFSACLVKPTLLPINHQAAKPPPYAITVPEPSLPGTTGYSNVPEYYPFIMYKSLGLITANSTLIST